MRKIIVGIFVIIVLFVVVFVCWNFYFKEARIEIQLDQCIDGDTAWFVVHGRKEKVRFLGIDTPESVHPNGIIEDYGKEASEYTCSVLNRAEHIYLEYDLDSYVRDKYNRILGWIFVDNNNLSELLLSKGYAEVKYVYGNYKYLNELCDSQENAYQNQLGIWSKQEISYEDNYCVKDRSS